MKNTALTLAALLLALGGCTNMLLPPNVAPVVAATASVPEAERKLASVAAQKAAIEAEFAASEQECYNKFFVNNCLDKAREKRRGALAYQKAIDVEAQYFRRKAAADERDREVARAVKEYEADEARAAALVRPPAAAPAQKPARPGRATLQDRRAAQEAKLAERAARERAEAPQRAAAVKEFEERRLDSAQRQREVAERVADREAKTAAPAEQKPAPPVKK